MPNTTVGIRYIHRHIGRVLEDISPYSATACEFGVDAACTTDYILTNPGTDTAATQVPGLQPVGFEDPTHSYNAIELTMDRRFSNNWLLLASYRYSRLRGTYEGFFREDNGQSDPGITSLYDFPTNDPNFTQSGPSATAATSAYLGELGSGPLPLDRPHQFKLSGNYSFNNGLGIGVGLNLSSGKPLTALASLPIYDNDSEIPETPRGGGFETIDGFKKRTPMEAQVDLQASLRAEPRRQPQAHAAGRRVQPVQHPPRARLQRRDGNLVRRAESGLRHRDLAEHRGADVPESVCAAPRRSFRLVDTFDV